MEVEFVTRRGKRVSFKARPVSRRSQPRKLGAFAKLVKRISKSNPRLKGPALFKAASKQYSPRR